MKVKLKYAVVLISVEDKKWLFVFVVPNEVRNSRENHSNI